MSGRPDNQTRLSPTLHLSEYTSPRNGAFGFWLYDDTRGMNLSMRAKTERDALVEALSYYQDRLAGLERAHKDLQTKVDSFLCQFSEDGGSE